MKTQYYTATSLDGFIADPDNSLSWLFQFGEGPGDNYQHFIAKVGALAMGSTTYEWLLEHMINPGADMKQPWPYTMPTWVFTSRTLPGVPGADIRFTKAPVPEVHAEMVAAASGKNVWIVGGGEMVGQFHDHGLLDELLVSMASVTLGAGAPLLPRRIVTPPLRLMSVEAWGTGMAHLVYEVQKAG
ncbi:MAG: dihydrofolate reductase family protein [Gemmatimonadaceae bacterium]